jgi:hypothetical protein
MKKILFLLLPFFVFSQVKTKKQLAHTYSIVAMDEKTGEMAVGVQSHWFSVGTIVSFQNVLQRAGIRYNNDYR